MGIATLIRKTVRFLVWGFYRPLHKARFATFDEGGSLLASFPAPVSLLLGVNRFKQFYHVRPTPTRRELGNLLVVAPTRGGKGLLAVSQLFTWGGSVIVNDIKGDLFQQTAGYRATLGNVYVIDPSGYGHRYDPLVKKQTEDELYNQAARLLFKPDEGEGAIFSQRATAMLTQLFIAASAENLAPLPYVRGIIRLGLQATAKRLHTIDPQIATQFLDVSYKDANFTDRFLLSAWGTLTARMRPLLTETVIRCFAASDFTSKELMQGEKPVTVYLRWPEQNLLALSPLVRLLWGSLIDELITCFDRAKGKNCKPVLLLVDEAGRTAIPTLADHATTVVGRGISLWLAMQSLSQLEAVYGKARAQVLKDNMESQIYYRPSDVATADYLEHRLGRKSGYARSQTQREGAETSQGKSEQGIPLMTAQEIMQMKDEQVLLFHRRLPPMKVRRVDFRHYPHFMKRRELPPPQLSALPAVTNLPLDETIAANEYLDPDRIHIN